MHTGHTFEASFLALLALSFAPALVFQFGTALRNAIANSVETTTGASAILHIYSGSPPAHPSDAPTGTLLVTMILPATWLTNAVAGVVNISGLWSGAGLAAGTAGYFRIYDPTDTTCMVQGDVSQVGGPAAAMMIDNAAIVVSQVVQVVTFTLTAPGA
jgi:hypothetical protein